ncbi:MAG: hypothetical protein LAO21_22920 [Acidobacteriia bacterium]|nr:hypothetical protein [Terriglobia bacterium]
MDKDIIRLTLPVVRLQTVSWKPLSSGHCKVLREIQLGHLSTADFTSPKVFVSGLYKQYELTIADLRRHIQECGNCAESMAEVRVQLQHFDEEQFAVLYAVLKTLEGIADQELDDERSTAEDQARDVLEHDFQPTADEAGMVEDLASELFAQGKQMIFFRTVARYSWVGMIIGRWLETFLPPSIPRLLVVHEDGPYDIGLSNQEVGTFLHLAPDLLRMLENKADNAAPFLRALFLAEAFQGLLPKASTVEEFLEKHLAFCWRNEFAGISWERLLKHYLMLADLEANQLSQSLPAPITRHSQSLLEKVELISQQLQQMDKKVDQLPEVLHDDHCIIMKQLEDLGRAHQQLIKAFDTAPAETRNKCQQIIHTALGALFDRLDEKTRSFLLTGEFGYEHMPSDFDFSGVILAFMKAFEHELHRSIVPIRERLQVIANKNERMKHSNKDLSRFTLGEWNRFFEWSFQEIEPLLRECGLDFSRVCEAIECVNMQKTAKHLDQKSYADATGFRALFLGGQSVLGVLFPKLSGQV